MSSSVRVLSTIDQNFALIHIYWVFYVVLKGQSAIFCELAELHLCLQRSNDSFGMLQPWLRETTDLA